MTLGPVDRRGLPEIIGLVVGTVTTCGALIVDIVVTKQVNATLLVPFLTMVNVLIARSSKSAADRPFLPPPPPNGSGGHSER